MTLLVTSKSWQPGYGTGGPQLPSKIQELVNGEQEAVDPKFAQLNVGTNGLQSLPKIHGSMESGRSLNQILSGASMEQFLMVLSDMTMKINLNSMQSMMDSLKTNNAAMLKISAQQLQKQIDAASKAMEKPQTTYWDYVFPWASFAISGVFLIAAIITCNPVLIISAAMAMASAVIELVILFMEKSGQEPPEWLQTVSRVLFIGSIVLGGVVGLVRGAAKLVVAGVRALYRALSRALSSAGWISLGKAIAHPRTAMTSLCTRIKDFFKNLYRRLSNKGDISSAELKSPSVKIAEGVAHISSGFNGVNTSIREGISTYYAYTASMIKAELLAMESDIWVGQIGIEYCQRQAKKLQRAIADAYQQQNNGVDLAMEALQRIAGIQDRIASNVV